VQSSVIMKCEDTGVDVADELRAVLLHGILR